MNETGVDFRNLGHPLAEGGNKVAAGKLPRFDLADGARENVKVVGGVRKTVRLLALPKLQAMLDGAKKFIGTGELVEVAAGDVTFVVKLLQRKKCSAGTEPALATTVHPLQALDEKLDVTNASAIEFDVDVSIAMPL